MEIISRDQAKRLGLRRYFTGVPCKHGHLDERRTINDRCITCCAISNKKTSEKHWDRRSAAWRARKAEWRRNNPEGVRAHKALRRARKRGAEGRFTKADIDELFAEQGGGCAYCLQPLPSNYHIDHFVPLSRGGSNWPSNLRLACGPCNCSKSSRDPREFMTECLKRIQVRPAR